MVVEIRIYMACGLSRIPYRYKIGHDRPCVYHLGSTVLNGSLIWLLVEFVISVTRSTSTA